MRAGPPLPQLTRRLAECPAEFLDAPIIGRNGSVNVAAVVGDVLHEFEHVLTRDEALPFVSTDAKKDRNRLQLVLLAAWVLADPALIQFGPSALSALAFLRDDLAVMSNHVQVNTVMDDPDRREELARLALARLDLFPAGESEVQAADRLSTISSAERQRVMEASKAAEARARDIREKLAAARAAESADKWNRE